MASDDNSNMEQLQETEEEQRDNSYTCKLCRKRYPNLEQCLAHEIIEHELRLNVRHDVKRALANCRPGNELDAVIAVFIMDDEKMHVICAEVIDSLKRAMGDMGNCEIHVYGSALTNLMLRNSDIDLFLQYERNFGPLEKRDCINILSAVCRKLRRSCDFDNIYFRRSASVPIITFKHVHSNFDIDLNISCSSSMLNNRFVRALLNFDQRLRQLVTFIKIWAKETSLIGKGNLTSYGIIMMAIFYLQNYKDPETQILLVPSVEQMQANETPRYEQGGNFAYNIADTMARWSTAVDVLELIKGFFIFYNKFQFERYLISPYLGKCVEMKRMSTEENCFPAYERQRKQLRELHGVEPSELALERAICVQDPFFLNHNITKAVVRGNMRFIRKCFQRAVAIVERSASLSIPKFIESLLFGNDTPYNGTVNSNNTQAPAPAPATAPAPAPTAPAPAPASNPQQQEDLAPKVPLQTLNLILIPCRTELKAIANYKKDASESNIYFYWTELYTSTLRRVITDIYALDMQLLSPTNRSKQQRLDYYDRSSCWYLSGNVDLWTGRSHEKKKNVPFMVYQLAQTQRMLLERRQNKQFAVQLTALLAINIAKNNKTIEVQIQKCDDNKRPCNKLLTRNDCVRKFFGMLKCSLQTANLKESLTTADIDWKLPS